MRLAACYAVLLALALPAAAQNAGYAKGFFIRSDDGDYTLVTNGQLQVRGVWEGLDTGAEDLDNRGAFSVPRARLKFSGNLFGTQLTYGFQIDFGNGFTVLKDAYADYGFIPGTLHLRAGQWKRPFSRQQMTSATKLEFTDPARTDKDFGGGRDLGIALGNNYESSPTFEWVVGLFNGTGEKPVFSGTVSSDAVKGGKFSNIPTTFHPLLVARVGWNHGGIKGYSEADLEGGPFRIAIGMSGLADFDVDKETSSAFLGELDTLIKYQGLSLGTAVYIASEQDGAGAGDQGYARAGFHVQSGFVIAQRFQPLLRFAMLMADGDDNDAIEALGGLAVYFWGQGAKLQLEGGVNTRETADGRRTDGVFRTQIQVAF